MRTKKLFALLLAAMMLLSVAPAIVFAVDLPTVPSVELSDGDGVITLRRGYVGFPEDKNVGQYEILYSADQTNWMVAGYMSRDRDSRLISIREPVEGQFVAGTTYYFAVRAVAFETMGGEKGPMSPVASIKYTNSAGEKRAEWEAVMAGYNTPTKETGTKYDKVKLVKGEKVTWDNGLYTLTVQVTAVNAKKATLSVTMKNKTGATFECFYINWKGLHAGLSADVHEGTKTFDVDLTKMSDGANYFQFSVTGYGNPVAQYSSVAKGNEYNDYADKLIYLGRKHTLYFQKAPNATNLSFYRDGLKLSNKAITFGTAYKSSSKAVKSGGSIVYYKAAGDKKWSKKSFAAGKTLTLSKLKANTEYSIRTINFVKSVSAADGKMLVTSKSGYSNTVKLRTGLATAPEIKSIKVSSKVVTIHHDAELWYNGAKWVYKEAYDSKQTNFTATVTLKSIPKGMKALQCSGLGAIGTQIVDVKKKSATFTFTGTAAASAKGKAINLTFLSYTNKVDNSWYAGTSPSVKKSVTL